MQFGNNQTFEIEFDNPAVAATGSQFVFDMGSGLYKKEIARARTFGMTSDIDVMRSRGLTLGGSMDNAIVVDDYKVLNADGLRYDDEFVKHKILDAIGVPEDRRSLSPSGLGEGGYAGLLDALPRGMAINVPPQLFTKIEDAQVAEWTARFNGG